MIYGETTSEYSRKRGIREAKEAEWHKHFAWFSVQLPDGKRAWLQWVETRTYWFTYEILPISGHWKTEYRLIKRR